MSERDRNQALGEGGEDEFAEGPADREPTPQRTSASQAEHEPDSNWQGTTGATDFLGLDGDLRLDPASSGSSVDSFPGLSNSGEAPVLDSWLMEIEGGAPAASATAESAEGELDEYAATGEEGDESDPSAPALAEPPARSRFAAQLLAVAVVVALCGGGAWYWQQQHNASTPAAPVEVATKPTPKSTPKPKVPAPAHDTTPTTGPVTDPTATSTQPDTTPDTTTSPTVTMPDPSAHAPTDPAGVNPDKPATGTKSNPETSPIDFTPGQLTITFPPPTPTPPAHVQPPTPVAKTEPRTTVPTKGGTMPGTVRRATEADFADLWREPRIPTELFQNDRRIRTLNVGRVRALVIGGEYFEGTLYAVGQGRIWLDVELGRISFEATTVREITQLPPLPVATNLKAKKADDLAALPHVEVRLPGGSVTGRLVGQDGRRVTLITDEGLRTVIESDDVRPVTARNTRVIGTVKELDANKPH
jgi:hypothetical protein